MKMNLIINKERVLPTWSKRFSKYSSSSKEVSSAVIDNIENEGSIYLNSSRDSQSDAKLQLSKLSFLSASNEFDMNVDIPSKSRNPNK